MVSSAKQKVRAPVGPGDLVANRYRVVRVLASGGMGVIVEAVHEQLKSKVALKFLHEHMLEHQHAKARFMREAMLAAKMRTEHVAHLFDVGTLESGAPYLVMDLLEGQDAAVYAKTHAPLPIAEAVEIVVQACDAMVHAHALGVIHRDLKPHNLFVTTRPNGTVFVRVLDFGVCKELGRPNPISDEPSVDLTLTESTVTVGSPIYMAPEQMRASKDAGKASDIWSLGVVLYELLAGRVPFDGATMTELCL
ncbi:MAG: serine/threonine-protein kinase, partial [Polyangiaceae bacterium]